MSETGGGAFDSAGTGGRTAADAGAHIPDGESTLDVLATDAHFVDGSADADEPCQSVTFYADRDDDGYGDPNDSRALCGETWPYTIEDPARATDCNDDEGTIHPGVSDAPCDGVDQDCGDDGEPCFVTKTLGSSTYEFSEFAASYSEAEAWCDTRGRKLVRIDSSTENDTVVAFAQSLCVSSLCNPTYIGISDRSTEGRWVWPDGSLPTFVAWAAGEPKSISGVMEADCGLLEIRDGNVQERMWRAGWCDFKTGFICE
jgi:hypothetical protein